MRNALLIIFCALSLSASAQFWKKKPKPVIEVFPRYDEVSQPAYFADILILTERAVLPEISFIPFKRSVYEIELAEDEVMKQAKHNMRFAIFNLASYNFSDLADLYVLENRFSEAKWYLLQSNELSRQQNDDKHTISNLVHLAAIKFAIGEAALAKIDLQEARDLANAKGFTQDVAAIDLKMQDLENNKSTSKKAELRYAQAVEARNKAQ